MTKTLITAAAIALAVFSTSRAARADDCLNVEDMYRDSSGNELIVLQEGCADLYITLQSPEGVFSGHEDLSGAASTDDDGENTTVENWTASATEIDYSGQTTPDLNSKHPTRIYRGTITLDAQHNLTWSEQTQDHGKWGAPTVTVYTPEETR